ncbi:hypothetical protein EWP70_13060, partial [Neisseria meningitidis]|nr:hypothetical protein [Neisseria meningitidis]MBG8659169.1 hypothetical protein [Neisseria meningitidis]
MFGNHGLGGLLEEGAHEKSPKCHGGNLGDFGEFCKGLGLLFATLKGKTMKKMFVLFCMLFSCAFSLAAV